MATNLEQSRKPAFGFERYGKYYAKTTHEKEYSETISKAHKHPKKFGNDIIIAAWGKDQVKYHDKTIKSTILAENARKIVGYIPVLGTIRGIGRIVDTLLRPEQVKPANNLARGVIEMLSLGIFLLPVDIAVTAYRHREWKKLNAQG